MTDSRRALEAHAYVDGCLGATERAAFEAAMARDSRLRARVDAWRSQNEAMQLSFGPAAAARPPARPSNENKPRILTLRRPSPALMPPRRPVAVLAFCTFIACALWPAGGPADPRAALAARADGALRAIAGAPLDFASSDPAAVAAWLSARLAGLVQVPTHATGWTLAGVRLVPGLSQTAALVVYEDALGERAGLLLERSDANPDWPSRVAHTPDSIAVSGVSRGLDYAAVGPRASGAAALALKASVQPPR